MEQAREKRSAEISRQKPKRPFNVTLFALGVLTITVLNLLRLVMVLVQWKFLSGLPGLSPLYLALSGLIWTLAGLPLFWGIWSGRSWAPGLAQALVMTYALYYWIDWVFVAERTPGSTNSAGFPTNWPFLASITFVIFAYTAWLFRRRKTRAFFGEENEQ